MKATALFESALHRIHAQKRILERCSAHIQYVIRIVFITILFLIDVLDVLCVDREYSLKPQGVLRGSIETGTFNLSRKKHSCPILTP